MAKKLRKWLGLGPDDIHGYYACTVNIAALLPSNRIAEGQFGLEQQGAGAISMQRHREDFLKIPYPEEEEDQVLLEKMMAGEPFQSMLMKRVAERAGLLDEAEQAAEEAALAGLPEAPGFQEEMMADQQMAAAGPGLPGSAGLAPQPGLGMPLQPTAPEAPNIGAMGGGRAAGQAIQPNSQMLPGGMPENS